MPEVTQTVAQQTAVVHLTIPREEIGKVMGPAIEEVMSGISAQEIRPAGTWFARYLKMDPGTFELEIGIPVEAPIAPAGRLKPSELPGGQVAQGQEAR